MSNVVLQLKGFKAQIGSWLTSTNYATRPCGTHIALGKGEYTTLDTLADQPRLASEIGRMPCYGTKIGSTARISSNFPAGYSLSKISEIGLLNSYSRKVSACDSIAEWICDPATTVLSTDASSNPIKFNSIIVNATPLGEITVSNPDLDANLSDLTMDDPLRFWFYNNDSTLNGSTLTVILGNDSSNYWQWEEVYTPLGWSEVYLNFNAGCSTIGTPNFNTRFNLFSFTCNTGGGVILKISDISIVNNKFVNLLARYIPSVTTAKVIGNNWKVVMTIVPIAGEEIKSA